ncbi:hypothetical protein [Paraburkholderia sp. J76]|uniref:hypothetical protein n=1 Tax=Paraburkholderia sp. J76 TaxID=2805439 RepID=UPI002ABE58F9|nr:hypothetical protein [Paraburkholderia sp. J76]
MKVLLGALFGCIIAVLIVTAVLVCGSDEGPYRSIGSAYASIFFIPPAALVGATIGGLFAYKRL